MRLGGSSLVKLFHEIDRATDATMVMMASTPDVKHTHLLLSRAISRDPIYFGYAHSARESFAFIAEARRKQRAAQAQARRREEPRRLSSTDDERRAEDIFAQLSGVDVNGIDGEENLKTVLDVALSNLRQLHQIYELRERRREEESERQRVEQANIETMLNALGLTSTSGSISGSVR